MELKPDGNMVESRKSMQRKQGLTALASRIRSSLDTLRTEASLQRKHLRVGDFTGQMPLKFPAE
jgi:hypothetical protein